MGYLEEMGTFSVVIAGEYNSGKSTLINALLGTKLLETGSIPTTDTITILSSSNTAIPATAATAAATEEYHNNTASNNSIRHHSRNNGIRSSIRNVGPGLIHHIIHDNTIPLLQDLTIVDTPGTNAVLTDHTATTLQLLPSADLILFVTNADRPFPESERLLLESIATHYRKSVVIIINKMDVLELSGGSHGQREKENVLQYVTEHASKILGPQPIIIPVSARDALSSKLMASTSSTSLPLQQQSLSPVSPASSVWERSNFQALELFLINSLTTETKIKSKLLNPLGIIDKVMQESLSELIQVQKQDLNDDMLTLNLLNNLFTTWNNEVKYDMDYFCSEIRQHLLIYTNRPNLLLRRLDRMQYLSSCLNGTQYLQHEWDQTKSIYTTSSKRNNNNYTTTTQQSTTSSESSSASKNRSEKDVLLDIVHEMADTIAIRCRTQGHTVIEFLGTRPSKTIQQSLIGNVTATSRFDDVRTNIYLYMSSAIEKHIDTDKIDANERTLLQQLQYSGYYTISLCTGTIGLSTITALNLMDPIIGSVFSTLGGLASFYMLSSSHRKRIGEQFIHNFQSNVIDKLQDDMNIICTKEMDRIHYKIQNCVQPYTNFIENENTRIEKLITQCNDITLKSKQLRARINKLNNSNSNTYRM